MQSYTRSFALTAALVLATVVGLLFVASPQRTPDEPIRTATVPPPAPGVVSVPGAKGGPTSPPVAPIAFADPDGQALILEDLSVRTAIHGMLSLTEIELRFRNPQERRIEGRFTCTLPPSAAISRFAKEVNGQLMEGEVVERLRANQVYEQFLHQMRDPALLEQDQGNRFSARIFPIDAHAPVRLILSYTALLPMHGGLRTWSMPLRGLTKIGKFSFRAFATALPGEAELGKMSTSTAEVTSFEERDWIPDRDLELSWRATGDAPETRLVRAGDFYLAAFRPPVVRSAKATAGRNWRFYVDTSASSAEGSAHRIRAIENLLGALPATDRVDLVSFDQEIVSLASGSAGELSRSAGALLRARLFLGGTDLGAMLGDVARALRADPSRRIVVASDLVPTLGTVAPNEIEDALGAIPSGAILHAVILGPRENAALAKSLTAGRGRIVRIPFTESLDARAREAAADLRRPLGESFDVADAGAEWVYPSHFDDVAAGDEIIALGKIKAGAEPRPSLGRRSAASESAASSLDASTFGPLLEREAYRAYLEYLSEREAKESSEAVRRALITEQVRISVEQRVVIPRTTMLVLESEWDYQRFGLDRRALAAILTIDAGGIGRIDRRGDERHDEMPPVRVPPPPTPPPPPRAIPLKDAPTEGAYSFDQGEESGSEVGVAGGVEGGVAGGVPGGVVGGIIGVAQPQAPVEAIEVSGDAVTEPEPAARIAPEAPASAATALRREMPRPRPARTTDNETSNEEKKSVDWTNVQRPSRQAIVDLEAKLRDHPRDRELYNQLSEALAANEERSALRRLALEWQPFDPENPQVYEILGIADSGLGKEDEAARAFASLIEIAPAKTELLQRAALYLVRAHRAKLAETPLRRALELRPDRVNSYRHLALMLRLEGRVEEAARVLESATRQSFPAWYGNAQRVIREELGYVYRDWLAKQPSRLDEIADRAREYGVDLGRTDALRVTLDWETDANDVDLHVVDPAGEECFYGHKSTRSGLALYEDITQGLGPEVIRTAEMKKGTYHIGVRYFSAGPMGISRGIVVVMHADRIEIHPFRLTEGGGEIRYVTGVQEK